MKKDYKKVEAGLLLLSSGASGILGQTANDVSAVRNGNSDQAKLVESTSVTNKRRKFFDFLFKGKSNAEKTNSDYKVKNNSEQENPAKKEPFRSLPKKEDSNIIKIKDVIMACLCCFIPIVQPIFLAGSAVLSLAFNALTKVPAIYKTFKTWAHSGNKTSHQLLAKLKRYNLASFKEMIKQSREERDQNNYAYDNSKEKACRDARLNGMIIPGKDVRRKDYIKSVENDKALLQKIFKKYGLDYESSKQNRKNFNLALEQLAILFYYNDQQDESVFNRYFCTLNYEEKKKEEGTQKKSSVGEEFNKKGVIELLYDWSKENDDVDDDLKLKIEELHKIINEKYDHWKLKYEEISKLYDGANKQLETKGGFKYTVKKENFLKEKLEKFTESDYDLEYLIKIFKEPQKYPILKEEFIEKIKKAGINYYEEFDELILNIFETAKESEQIYNGEIGDGKRKKYFELLKNVEKIAKNENLKNEFYKLLSKFKENLEQSEGVVYNKCIGFIYESSERYFLETIGLIIPFILGENVDTISRINKDKYSEEDIKAFFTTNDPNYIKMKDFIIDKINSVKIESLPPTLEELKDNGLIEDEVSLTPEKILDILENKEETKVDNRTIEKFFKWCENNATEELYSKVERIYKDKSLKPQNGGVVEKDKEENKNIQKENKSLERKQVKPKKQKYNEKDLKELFEKCALGEYVDLDFLEIAGTDLCLNSWKGEKAFSEIILSIIEDGENVKIGEELIKEAFWDCTDFSEGKVIKNFLKWCKNNATEEYFNKLEKIYVKKEFNIEGEYNKKENLEPILKNMPLERVEAFAKLCKEIGKPTDYIKEVNRSKEQKQLGLKENKKCSRNQFLAILKDMQDAFNYKYPLLRKEIENSIIEFFQRKDSYQPFLGNHEIEEVISDLTKWLEDEDIADRYISLDPDTSKFLLNLVYKKVDNEYLENRPGHSKVVEQKKKLKAGYDKKYSKEQMVTILENKDEYPLLYKQVKNYTERKYGSFMKKPYIDFSKVADKMLKRLKNKKLDVSKSCGNVDEVALDVILDFVDSEVKRVVQKNSKKSEVPKEIELEDFDRKN